MARPPRAAALGLLADPPVRRIPYRRLRDRRWELRHNLTPYYAAYVGVAEALGAILLTADSGLANAPGVRCQVDVLTS